MLAKGKGGWAVFFFCYVNVTIQDSGHKREVSTFETFYVDNFILST